MAPPPFCSLPARANGVQGGAPIRARTTSRRDREDGRGHAASVAGTPYLHLHAGMPPLPFALPHAHAMGRRRTRRHPNQGALKGSGPRPALHVRMTPRAFHVPDPYAPPFACHVHIVPHAGQRAQGVMRKVGCRGQARRTTRGVVRTPPPRRCAMSRA